MDVKGKNMRKRPNIILFLSDQQRWDTLSYAGVVNGVMPNLDRLAEEGTLFENCFSVQPLCGPSRACLQSGRYATETDNYVNGRHLPYDANTVASILRDNGYDTAYIGKWHLSKDNYSFTESAAFDVPIEDRGGFDYWRASNLLEYTSHAYDGFVYDDQNNKVFFQGYRPDKITDMAIDYLKCRSTEKPFYMVVSHIEPHHQNDEHSVIGPEGSKEKYGRYPLPGDLDALEGNTLENYADYLGACNSLDNNVGKLERYLVESGQWENTCFIYTSDHGCHFKTRNGEYKRSCHDASLHVPLVFHGKGFNLARRVSGMVSLLDVPSSILAVAGLEIPDNYRGCSLLKIANGEEKTRTSVFAQITESAAQRVVRTDRWKYCISSPDGFAGFCQKSPLEYDEAFLYDLEEDPNELINLIADNRFFEVKRDLKELLLEYVKEVESVNPKIRGYNDIPPKPKYTFDMSIDELAANDETRVLLEKYFPAVLNEQHRKLTGSLSFYQLGAYMLADPDARIQVYRFKQELESLE